MVWSVLCMSLRCWSNTNAVRAACTPSGCVHIQNKPLHLYLDGDQRASNIGSACLGLCPWSVPPALFLLLDLSWSREAGALWLCQWPSCSLASPKAQQWGSCWGNELLCHTLVYFFCTGPGPSFPQESQSLGAAISPVPYLALLETGRGHEHLFQQQGKAPRALTGDDGLLH